MGSQCPARGPGLGHVHFVNCAEFHSPKHDDNQCCHCGIYSNGMIPCPVCEKAKKIHKSDGSVCYLPGCLQDVMTCPFCEGRGLYRPLL